MNPSIRLPDYTNLTSSIRLQLDDCRIMTITNYNQCHIHTHIHIQLHLHNHTFTIEFWHQLIKKNYLLQTMTTYTKTRYKRTPRYQRSINHAQIPNAPQFSYISGRNFFAYNARMGRFQTGDNARVYLWQNFRSA